MRTLLFVLPLTAAVVAGLAVAAADSKSDALAAFKTFPCKRFCRIRAVVRTATSRAIAPLQFDEGSRACDERETRRRWERRSGTAVRNVVMARRIRPPHTGDSHVPPGAPNWHLPPTDKKMVFVGLSSADLCRRLKDMHRNNGRDLPALIEHVDHDKLVLWGWNPGEGRRPVSVPHDEFVAAFKTWAAAGAPCG